MTNEPRVKSFLNCLLRIVETDGCYAVQGGWNLDWEDVSLWLRDLDAVETIAQLYLRDGEDELADFDARMAL